MGPIEDIRQVLQDFLAPELRAVHARLDAIQENLDTRFDAVKSRFGSLEEVATARHNEILSKIEH